MQTNNQLVDNHTAMNSKTTKLRIKITRLKENNYSSKTNSYLHKARLYMLERVKKILDTDALPLIMMPIILIAFTCLEWWHWYQEMLTPSPILLSLIAIGLSVFCYYKLTAHKGTS